MGTQAYADVYVVFDHFFAKAHLWLVCLVFIFTLAVHIIGKEG